MNPKNRHKTTKSVIGILFSIVLFFSSGMQIPGIDSAADAYFKESITKAGVSYGVCRVINATVSVIQESSLQLEPAGIGLSLAVGQIVDPINDMVERLSNVLVMSIASLGVQELAYAISLTIVPQILAILLLSLSVLVWFENTRVLKLQRILLSVLVIAAIARFCLPVSSVVNEFLQETFFEEKIVAANEKLSASTVDIDRLQDVSMPKLDGFWQTIGGGAFYIKEKSVDFKNTIEVIMDNKGAIVENLLRLTFLYLGIFVIQVLVVPLLMFWFVMRVVNSLFPGATTITEAPSGRPGDVVKA